MAGRLERMSAKEIKEFAKEVIGSYRSEVQIVQDLAKVGFNPRAVSFIYSRCVPSGVIVMVWGPEGGLIAIH
jgi:hypothetical protein